MPSKTERQTLLDGYILSMILNNIFSGRKSGDNSNTELENNIYSLYLIAATRYLNERPPVPKSGNMHLAWEFSSNPSHFHRFRNMLRVSPVVFDTLLSLIENHPVFSSDSHVGQAPVENQLAVTLFRMGRYGNGASVEDIARTAGCSEGSVENYTQRCITAILSLQAQFVRKLEAHEKEQEKQYMDHHVGFRGLWREGWVMYDGTIVVLFRKPAQNGDAYYTRKANYGLNVQIGNTPSNLRIVDFSHGMTGSAHDSAAFEHTTAGKYPEWFFDGLEFAWADSAYAVTPKMIPVHKKPASLVPKNALFDKTLAHLRVRSEHCMGALKGRFQCLRGLRLTINNNGDHFNACQWITAAIILHNMVIDVEGTQSALYFAAFHGPAEEEEDTGVPEDAVDIDNSDNNSVRRQLVDELWQARNM